jgi:prepilin signal peptidase PulO-like enzyme (type II secretory pathway)
MERARGERGSTKELLLRHLRGKETAVGVPVRVDDRTEAGTTNLPHAGVRSGAFVWTTGVVTVTVAVGLLAVGAAPPAALAVAVMVRAAAVDLRERRLSDAVVLGSGVVLVVGLLATWAGAGEDVAVRGVVVGAGAMAGPLLALHLLAPSAMGFGDVKAAVVLGAALGSVDGRLAVLALAVGSAAGSLLGLARRSSTIPFGPFLVAGAAAALAAGAVLLPELTSGVGR